MVSPWGNKWVSCLEKQIIQGTMSGARRRGRLRTAWMDNTKTWTGLSVEESIRMTEDGDKWRKYMSIVRPTLGSRTAKKQNRTVYPAHTLLLLSPLFRLHCKVRLYIGALGVTMRSAEHISVDCGSHKVTGVVVLLSPDASKEKIYGDISQ